MIDMRLLKPAKAGTYESNDIYIMLYPIEEATKIEVESIVSELYGKRIREVIETVLDEYKLTNVYVKAIDKGALDYAIHARLVTAIKRGLEHE